MVSAILEEVGFLRAPSEDILLKSSMQVTAVSAACRCTATGSAIVAGQIFDNLRDVTQQQLHTAIYTHGHVDHIAVNHMDWEAPYRVVAQENVVRRFDRQDTSCWLGRASSGWQIFMDNAHNVRNITIICCAKVPQNGRIQHFHQQTSISNSRPLRLAISGIERR